MEENLASMIFMNADLPIEERVKDLVSRLTLDEKVAQMVHNAEAIPHLGIPEYSWWNECLHGVARAGKATVFPQAIGMAASFDPELMFQVATAISDEARAKHHQAALQGNRGWYFGLTFWSPNINIFRDPRWGRGHETYGEDPYLTSRMGVAFVRGLQGDDPRYLKLVATPKHYAVHSGPEPARHGFDAVVGQRDLRETYLPAFKACVQEGHAASVMGAYNRTNGEPCCASKTLLQDILRDEWGFEGYVVSDCGAICDIHEHHKITKNPPESAALAVRNGCELNCGAVYPSLVAAVQMGLIDEEKIDDAVGRLMTARFRLGMFDPPGQVPYSQIPPEIVNCERHRSLALQIARESIVLLKNEKSLLPLDKEIRSIAVVGPTAFSPRALVGNYYGFSPRVTTILEGIVGAVSPGTQVNYAKGCPLADEPPTATDMIDCDLEDVDAIIAVLGNTAELEGEEGAVADSDGGGDRSQIGLPGRQEDLLRDLHATGKPVVLVLTGGSPIALGWAAENIPAIVMAWYPGEAGGEAVADVLFGDYNPSGRLPVTFVKSLDQVPPFEDYCMEGRTYRFLREEPLYRFGYGLSYTKFEYSNLRLGKDRIGPNESLSVTVEVENVGTAAGDEVVQMYVRDVESSVPVPIHHLEGIQRLDLKPGEKREVSFTLHSEQLVVYGDDGKSFVEPGEFVVSVGGCQPGTPGQAETQYRSFRVGIDAHAIESRDG